MQNTTGKPEIPDNCYNLADGEEVCFACGQPRYKLLHKINHFGFPVKFQKCACGLIKQTPVPNESFFEWFYNSDLFFSARETKNKNIWGFYDFFKDEDCRLKTSRFRYEFLKKYLAGIKPANILKVGPATGTFLYVAGLNGHRAAGCDLSTRFIEYAKDKYDVQIDHGRFETLPYKEQSIDMLLIFNVLENIPNPGAFFRAASRVLKPNGFIVLNFVDMQSNWIARIQKGHYFLFRPPICYAYAMTTLKEILSKYGFDVISTRPDIRFLHLEKIMTLLGWHWLLKLCPFRSLLNHPFPIYAYPSKLLIAQKKRGVQ